MSMPQHGPADDPECELYEIQRLQFLDVNAASQKLLEHFHNSLPFRIIEARIVPRAVSLNSISGLLISNNGEKYFFKTHVEPASILREYYNVQLLERAGYPIVQPVYASHKPGHQIVIYPYLSSPTMFDVIRDAERDYLPISKVLHAQVQSDLLLYSIYERTITASHQSPQGEESPIHQLFYHRLAGTRFVDFYFGKSLNLAGVDLTFAKLAGLKWTINGVEYRQNLDELVKFATRSLKPDADWGPTIVGHGDAHNGNLFFNSTSESLIYFDPAFAGRHSPILDLAKPLFHNVFATWMYFPNEVDQKLQISWQLSEDAIEVTHDYTLSSLRLETLRSKLIHVLAPLLQGSYGHEFRKRDWLRLLKAALFCCPLLTVNLFDSTRFPTNISVLGLSHCVEVGADAVSSSGVLDSLLESALDSSLWK